MPQPELAAPTSTSCAHEADGLRLETVRGNLLSRDACARAAEGAVVVYHLAAGVEKTFPGCFLNSAVATRNLLDAVLATGALKRFVNTSSLAVYDNVERPRAASRR